MPLLDVTGLSLTELATSQDTVLARSIRERLADIDDDRNPVLSAFGSFISS
ncbi:MAG: FxSxx-COOH cyclophane-containing RiPP peptide [Actinoplanes sp.]